MTREQPTASKSEDRFEYLMIDAVYQMAGRLGLSVEYYELQNLKAQKRKGHGWRMTVEFNTDEARQLEMFPPKK